MTGRHVFDATVTATEAGRAVPSRTVIVAMPACAPPSSCPGVSTAATTPLSLS
jgi:hypothetical protein